MKELHSIELVRIHDDGSEEWRCSECGRWFRIRWPPSYMFEVLVAGDEEAIHVSGSVPGAPTFALASDGRSANDFFQVEPPPQIEEPGWVPLTPELEPWLRLVDAMVEAGTWLD